MEDIMPSIGKIGHADGAGEFNNTSIPGALSLVECMT
jgi:hypothetical protein